MQNHTQCRQPSTATTWEGEEGEERWENGVTEERWGLREKREERNVGMMVRKTEMER